MRISKRTREQAALICAIAASTPDCREFYARVADGLGGVSWNGAEIALAYSAWQHVYDFGYSHPGAAIEHYDAEAHALIMTGWSP